MSKCHPNEDDKNFVLPCLQIGSFIMLCMLTWAASPIQKLFENIQKKEKLIATYYVCDELRSSLDVYEEYMEGMFETGCMFTTRNANIELFPDRKEEILKLFEQKSSIQYENWLNNCSVGATNYVADNKLKEGIASPIYHHTLNCPKVYDDLKKLGIKEEDLDERRKDKNKN